MLPTPVSFAKRRPFRKFNVSGSHRRRIDVLLSRSRVTNLSLLLLVVILVLSLLANLRTWLSWRAHWLPRARAPPRSIAETVPRARGALHLDHLVVVPGHAVWTGAAAADALDERAWVLEPHQRGGGRVAAFVEHIRRGAALTEQDARSLLVFSGGQTRWATHETEGASYLSVAAALKLLDPATLARTTMLAHTTTVARTTTENYALDSFQNLLFSIARFHEVTGRYPEKITVVGYEMKRRRFEELHRHALRWPRERFKYIGSGPDAEHAKDAYTGEEQNGYLPYSADMYGCHGLLLAKRRDRNTFDRYHPYHASSPELSELFEWCPEGEDGGYTALFPGELPWDI